MIARLAAMLLCGAILSMPLIARAENEMEGIIDPIAPCDDPSGAVRSFLGCLPTKVAAKFKGTLIDDARAVAEHDADLWSGGRYGKAKSAGELLKGTVSRGLKIVERGMAGDQEGMEQARREFVDWFSPTAEKKLEESIAPEQRFKLAQRLTGMKGKIDAAGEQAEHLIKKAENLRAYLRVPDADIDPEGAARAQAFNEEYGLRAEAANAFESQVVEGAALDVTPGEQLFLGQQTALGSPDDLPDVYLSEAAVTAAEEAGLLPDQLVYVDPDEDPYHAVAALPLEERRQIAQGGPDWERVEPTTSPPPGYEELPGDPNYPSHEDDEPESVAVPGRGTLSGGYENVPPLYNEEEFARSEQEAPAAGSGEDEVSLDDEIHAALSSSRAQAQQRRSGGMAGSTQPSRGGPGSVSVAGAGAQGGGAVATQESGAGSAACAALRRAAEQQADEYRRALNQMDVDRRACDPDCGADYYTAYELYQEGERQNRDFARDPICDATRPAEVEQRLRSLFGTAP